MAFKKKENSIIFCFLCIIILWGIASFMLINDYQNLPNRKLDPDYRFGEESYYQMIHDNKPTDYSINPFDGVFSFTENGIIWIFFLWGFMRVIDLIKLFEKTEKDNNPPLTLADIKKKLLNKT